MTRRDVLAGVLFFLGMAAFGALLLYIQRGKWQMDMRRQRQQYEMLEANRRYAAGKESVLRATTATDPKERLRQAQDAIDHLTYVIEKWGATADPLAARAKAYTLAGDRESAKKDLARARALEPSWDWSELERLCGTTP